MYADQKMLEVEYDEKRSELLAKREKIMLELAEHNKGDDNFNECMIRVLKLAANSYRTFNLSNNEEKRRILKLMFSTIILEGSKPLFTLVPAFGMMQNIGKIDEWYPIADNFRQIYELRILILSQCIDKVIT